MEEMKNLARERSSFAVTCSLLSQFLKENRSYGDLQGIDRLYQQQQDKGNIYQSPTTMNLFPGSDVAAETQNKFTSGDISNRNATKSMESFPPEDTGKTTKRVESMVKEMNAPLTIFYNGKVMIFDNFPAIKAKDLIQKASEGKVQPFLLSEVRDSALSMPIARRASLHRFLEKRKDRINSNAPYLVKGLSKMDATASEIKPEKNQPWLALGQNSSFSSD